MEPIVDHLKKKIDEANNAFDLIGFASDIEARCNFSAPIEGFSLSVDEAEEVKKYYREFAKRFARS